MKFALRVRIRACAMLTAFLVSPLAAIGDEPLRLRLTLKGHTDHVKSVCFNSEGTGLASGGLDETVRVWDVATGKPAVVFSQFGEAVDAVAFSPCEQAVAWGTRNHLVRIRTILSDHDVAKRPAGKSKRRFADSLVPVPSVNCIAFSPDGLFLAVAGDNSDVAILNVYGRTTKSIKSADSEIFGIAYSPDGKRLAAGGYEGIHLWEVGTTGLVGAIDQKSEPIFGIAFSPDGALLASAGRDARVRLWESSTGRQVAKFEGHSSSVFCVAFSPDGRYVASGGADQTVRLWEVATGRNSASLKAHDSTVFSLAFRPDGKMLASSSADKTIKLWDVAPVGREPK